MTQVPRHRLVMLAVFAAMAVLAWLAYSPAFSGKFALDDTANLSGLAAINDNIAALRFVFTGEAGPLGRPLALASFLPQADAWSEGPRSFLQVNVLIHIVNSGLLAWMLLLLGRNCRLGETDQRIAAMGATAIWLFLPLLASASLMVVQRMTTLSATFVLLGIIGWLLARPLFQQGPVRGYVTAFLALSVATVLAALCKENGALLPLYVLVLESTLLTAPPGTASRQWRLFKGVVLGMPVAAMMFYVIARFSYADSTILRLDMTGWERLLTEAGILWTYLFKTFLPLPGSISPFNDSQQIARSLFAPATLLAVLSWLLLLVLAIRFRRSHALAAFAVLWFLGGHLIESTTIPLELYFDHRNYLPVIGPVFAAVVGLLGLAAARPFARALIPLYALIQCGMLVLLTSLWGKPLEAAHYWHAKQPTSVRAASTLVSRQLEREGVEPALATLQSFVQTNPGHAYLLIQDVNIACQLNPTADHSAQMDALGGLLKDVRFTFTASTMLSELINVAASSRCQGVDPKALRNLVNALYANPRYQAVPLYRSQHHELLALTYRIENNFDGTLAELQRAAAVGTDRNIVIRQIVTMAQAGRTGDARALLETARKQNDWHPVRQWLRLRDLDELKDYIAAVEAASDAEINEEQDQ